MEISVFKRSYLEDVKCSLDNRKNRYVVSDVKFVFGDSFLRFEK